MNLWRIVRAFSCYKLTDKTFIFLTDFPKICFDVNQVDLSARIRNVAPQSDWIQETFMDGNIFKGNVSQGDQRLCGTCPSRIKGIYHASRSRSSWLPHLLWTEINGPPDWSIHRNVFVIDIWDVSPSVDSWVRLDVDSLERTFHLNISESNIPDAASSHMRWHTSDTHPNPQPHFDILH